MSIVTGKLLNWLMVIPMLKMTICDILLPLRSKAKITITVQKTAYHVDLLTVTTIMTTVRHLGHFILIFVVSNRFYNFKISATYSFRTNTQGKCMNLIFPGLYLFPNTVALKLQIIIQI